MTIPVWSLDEFFPTYLALLQTGDADSLGLLYAERAVLTSTGGPDGQEWAVGREQIVASLRAALQQYNFITETAATNDYELRGDSLAARFGIFQSTIAPKAGGPSMDLTVEAIEVYALSPTDGWQYISDQSRVVFITKSRTAQS
jgi:hypothetical protein